MTPYDHENTREPGFADIRRAVTRGRRLRSDAIARAGLVFRTRVGQRIRCILARLQAPFHGRLTEKCL